jgi:DNA polymerase-4
VRIQAELGLPAVAGIGRTRFASYLAAKHAGPGGILHVRDSDSLRFLSRFPVTELWGLGPATAARLARHGIELVGDLQVCQLDRLREIAGRDAARLLALARAEDADPLHPRPPARTLSQERTLSEPTLDAAALGEAVAELARRVEGALERERRVPRSVTLGADYAGGGATSRTMTADRILETPGAIAEVATRLLGRLLASDRPIRRLRLRVGRLARGNTRDDSRQLRLF